MKNLTRTLLFVSAIAFLASCTKDNDNNGNNTNNKGKFEFYANGTLITMNLGVDVHENLSTTGSVLNVAATSGGSNANTAVGGINGYAGVGSYNLAANNSSYIGFSINGKTYYMTGGNVLAPKASGTWIITEEKTSGNFKNTKGTFSGVAYYSNTDSIVITNGVFIDDDF